MHPGRVSIWYWISLVYLCATVVFNIWIASNSNFYFADDVQRITVVANLGFKLLAITALIFRKGVAAYLLCAAFAVGLVGEAWIYYVLGNPYALFGLPGFAISLLVIFYTFRLKNTGFLRPWRNPDPAAVF